MEFATKLRMLARQNRYSQEDLAEQVGVSQSLMSNWMNGKQVPDLRESLRLADLLGVDLRYLADDAMDEPPPPLLSEDERAIVVLYRSLEIDEVEAMRRLTKPAPDWKPGTPMKAKDVTPPKPGKEDGENPRKGKSNNG